MAVRMPANGYDDLGLAAGLLVPPPPAKDFSHEDMELWRAAMRSFELAMRRQARWYAVATGKSSPRIKGIVIPAGGAVGNAVRVLEFNLERIATQIYVPTGASQMYYALDSMFGTIDTVNNLAQFGQFVAANSYVEFGPEYPGEVWMLNAAASASATVRVAELRADETVW